MRPLCPAAAGLSVVVALIISSSSAIAGRPAASAKAKPIVETPRMVFQSLYSKADTAFENKDLDGGLEFHDPEFVQVQKGGDEIDIGEIRFRVSSWLDMAQTVHSDTSVVSANIVGVNGTVMVKSSMTMVLINPDTKAKSYFIDRVVSKDSWSHEADGWMLLRSQVISELTTNDGHKVYDMDNPFTPAPKPDDDDPTDTTAPEPPVDTPQPSPTDN